MLRAYLHAIALIAFGRKHFSRFSAGKQLTKEIRVATVGIYVLPNCTGGHYR